MFSFNSILFFSEIFKHFPKCSNVVFLFKILMVHQFYIITLLFIWVQGMPHLSKTCVCVIVKFDIMLLIGHSLSILIAVSPFLCLKFQRFPNNLITFIHFFLIFRKYSKFGPCILRCRIMRLKLFWFQFWFYFSLNKIFFF